MSTSTKKTSSTTTVTDAAKKNDDAALLLTARATAQQQQKEMEEIYAALFRAGATTDGLCDYIINATGTTWAALHALKPHDWEHMVAVRLCNAPVGTIRCFQQEVFKHRLDALNGEPTVADAGSKTSSIPSSETSFSAASPFLSAHAPTTTPSVLRAAWKKTTAAKHSRHARTQHVVSGTIVSGGVGKKTAGTKSTSSPGTVILTAAATKALAKKAKTPTSVAVRTSSSGISSTIRGGKRTASRPSIASAATATAVPLNGAGKPKVQCSDCHEWMANPGGLAYHRMMRHA